MYSCIIFDVDGTIINTEKAVIGSLQKTLKDLLGRNFAREELAFVLGIPGSISLPMLGIQNVDEANILWNDYMKQFYTDIHVYPNFDLVLKTLHDANIKTGIVTSKTKQQLQDDFIPFGLMKYLPFAVTADDTLKHKPNPDPLHKFIEISRVEKSEAIYIGDTVYDMQCAADAGIDFGLALWGAPSVDGIHAQYKLEDPLDILKLISPAH
ncbi:HAD family hydrolase [Paenibacillus sp. GSMTC-2017]|uniref:HAD family hydrolase n=1 Tax=Paenibacillus sp. GSMTC-2017 TaxID=2794350 RepID=UPI0018D9B15C|nr:HAD family hydrolase [Paenibacillus sp. GSMTC-2017]MBH5317490.1 HAD family hydrolase [Paenibacillus sp. GSMTC-2017]